MSMATHNLSLLVLLFVSHSAKSCSYFNHFNLFDLHEEAGSGFEYWELPKYFTPTSREEAIMLIGGVHCTSRECPYNYSRLMKGESGEIIQLNHSANLPHFEDNIMFYTKYGFCRRPPDSGGVMRPFTLPRMPVHIAGAGAVAIPDGRVLICGGQIGIHNKQLDAVEVKDNNDCWYWLYNDVQIRKLEFQSKLPYEWLGPLNQLMHGIHLAQTPEIPSTMENNIGKQKIERKKTFDFLSKFRNIHKKFNVKAFFEERKKYYTDSTVDFSKVYDNFRIIIAPWASHAPRKVPRRLFGKIRIKSSGSYIIEGRLLRNDIGPKIVWRKHRIPKAVVGYGGCTTIGIHKETKEIFLFGLGGRQMKMNPRQNNEPDWTQSSYDVAKYLRGYKIQQYIGETSMRPRIRFLPINNVGVLMANISNFSYEKINLANYKLDEDRTYATCHTIQEKHRLMTTSSKADIIMIGGGTTLFYDRPAIEMFADLYKDNITRATKFYKNIAAYSLTALSPRVTGQKIQQHRGYGFGLNFPRTRHTSQIIKIRDAKTGQYYHRIVVLGGYCIECKDMQGNIGTTLDVVEEMNLYPDKTDVFRAHSSFQKRLPWPLMDITSVKIPVEWLPPECYVDYYLQELKEMKKGP